MNLEAYFGSEFWRFDPTAFGPVVRHCIMAGSK